MIHNCLVIHSSANKSNKNRKGFTIQFKDKKAKYDLTQKRKYEKSLNKQIKKEFKIIYMPGFEIIDKEEFLAVKKYLTRVAFYLPMDLKI